MKEEAIDSRLTELDRSLGGGDPFRAVLARAKARPEYERLLAGYMKILQRDHGSTELSLKLLRGLDDLRAPDIGRQIFRTARIGDLKRVKWPGRSVKPDFYGLGGKSGSARLRRGLCSSAPPEVPILNLTRREEKEDFVWQLPAQTPTLDS